MSRLVLVVLLVLLLPIAALAGDATVPTQPPSAESTWLLHLASAIAAAVSVTVVALIAAWRLVVTHRDYEKDWAAQAKKCDDCETKIAGCVTKEKFRDIIRPMRAEARHRRRQFNVLGWRMVSMDRKLTALLVANKIDVREFESPDRPVEEDREDDSDDSDLNF